jgi:AcrR family transcriptional regulator
MFRMNTPPRILRAWVEDAHGRPPPSARELDRDDAILKKAGTLFFRTGRRGVTLAGLSLAVRMSPGTIRMAFCDLDNILFEILWRYLARLRDAVAAIPEDNSGTMPGHIQARVRAYLDFVRCGLGGLTDSHVLLTRERHGLPPDLAEPIEALRHQIGEMIAGHHAPLVLAMLDTPYVEAETLLPMLQALFTARAETEPAAAETQATPSLPEPTTPAPQMPEAARNFTLGNRRPIDLSGPPLGPDRIEDFLRAYETQTPGRIAPPGPEPQRTANPEPAPRQAA